LAKKPGEIESFQLLAIKRQLATGFQPLAKIPVTAKNDCATAAKAAITRFFSAITGTSE